MAAMQFIKSQKERPRRYVTISRSPVLISDAGRGASRWALRIALDRSRILADFWLAYLRFAGGDAVLEWGTGCLSIRYREGGGLGGLGGSVVSWEMPQSKHGPSKTHTSQSRPHRVRQGPPMAVRPVAAAYWRLILQDIHRWWIEATEEPQVGPSLHGRDGSCGARIPEPLSRQIHNRQHTITLALEATYISKDPSLCPSSRLSTAKRMDFLESKCIAWACRHMNRQPKYHRILPEPRSCDKDEIWALGHSSAVAPLFPPCRPTQNP